MKYVFQAYPLYKTFVFMRKTDINANCFYIDVSHLNRNRE